MKRLYILAGLAMLALATPTPSEAACNNWDTECLKKEAAQGQQGWPKEMPAECTGYGAANTKPAHCAQWEGWQPGMPPPGQRHTWPRHRHLATTTGATETASWHRHHLDA